MSTSETPLGSARVAPSRTRMLLSRIVFDEALYPRKDHDPELVQRYSTCLDEIEAAGCYLAITEDGRLLDGKHRWLAYRTRYAEGGDPEIPVRIYHVTTSHEQFALAVELNSQHGYQLTAADKKQSAIKLYEYGYSYETIGKTLSVRKDTVADWLSRTVKEKKDRENERLFDLWLACHTQQEIAEAVGLLRATVDQRLHGEDNEAGLLEKFRGNHSSKSGHIDWIEAKEVPLYDVMKQQVKSEGMPHPGNSEPRLVDTLLYLYTQPFNIVIDPFAGGASTIDVCKQRLRRYWVSDRKPIVAREHEIRQWDITDCLPPLHNWKDAKLVYLDPPYWKQAEGKYSDDPTDLANMDLATFTKTLANLIKAFSKKLPSGAHIALLMAPTQWNAPEHQYTHHVWDLARLIKLPVAMCIQCPYESQQATAQMLEWAKANRTLLAISRELVIWRVP